MEKLKINEFKLIGLNLGHKTTNVNGQSNIDCGSLWQKFENENFIQRIPNRLSDNIYSIYFEYEGDHTKPFSYFIGCKVRMDSETPSDMTSLIIAEDNYTKVIAKGKMPDCVANAWKEIWQTDIKRQYKCDFEIYGELSKDWNDSEVEIFVSSN